MSEDFQEYLKFAHQLADAAGDIARHYYTQLIMVEMKSDQTPVTIADRVIEQRLREMIASCYPAHGVMGEEYGEGATSSEFSWVIDPIDGTKAFMAGFPTFTTLIGLLRHTQPLIGLVDQPVLQKRWSAISSSDPVVSKALVSNTMQGARLATTSVDYLSVHQKQGVEALKKRGAVFVYSGDAYSYMMLAEGKLDVVFDVDLKPYDILPILPILYAKGICVKFFESGKQVGSPTGNVVAAATESLCMEVLACLL